MKLKTDLYTKIVLTVIAAALIGLLVKDVEWVSKAQASPLDLSGMKVKDVSSDEDMTFFIYENSKIKEPFSKSSWNREECKIEYEDIPTYIITNKKVRKYSNMTIKKAY